MTMSIPDGNIVDRYRIQSNRRKIVLGLAVAFVIRILATIDAKGAEKGKGKVRESLSGQNYVAWVALVAMLAIASDIESTSEIAVAFTILIVVAAILTSGIDALDNLNVLISSGKKVQKSAVTPSNKE